MDELDDRMTAKEFGLWRDEWVRNPWGDQRADIHTALLAERITNMAGKMRKEDAKLSDYILDFDRKEEPELDPMAFFNTFVSR